MACGKQWHGGLSPPAGMECVSVLKIWTNNYNNTIALFPTMFKVKQSWDICWSSGDILYARFESSSRPEEVQKAQDPCPPVISRADVCRSLKRINTHKSPGPDGIPGRALKVCADQLADVFTDIFNLSLLQSVVPTCFKKTTIVPVPKKSRTLCLND